MTEAVIYASGERKLKDCLTAITNPTNKIVARLQAELSKNIQQSMVGYSRMHNRHNRS